MFWNRKPKLPVTEEDKKWVDEAIYALKKDFGLEHFFSIRTVTPTKNFYNKVFNFTADDAFFILQRTKELMLIINDDIKLDFFSDQPIEMSDGLILSSPADIYGRWESASGTYEDNGNETIITIEMSQLKDTISLIATIAHELAHEILLGENWITENDEYLTDLTAVFYGFGIFIGNSAFSFESYQKGSISGWKMKNQGYLPEQIIAYAMAKLSIERNESLEYNKFMSKSMKKYFEQSIKYLTSEI